VERSQRGWDSGAVGGGGGAPGAPKASLEHTPWAMAPELRTGSSRCPAVGGDVKLGARGRPQRSVSVPGPTSSAEVQGGKAAASTCGHHGGRPGAAKTESRRTVDPLRSCIVRFRTPTMQRGKRRTRSFYPARAQRCTAARVAWSFVLTSPQMIAPLHSLRSSQGAREQPGNGARMQPRQRRLRRSCLISRRRDPVGAQMDLDPLSGERMDATGQEGNTATEQKSNRAKEQQGTLLIGGPQDGGFDQPLLAGSGRYQTQCPPSLRDSTFREAFAAINVRLPHPTSRVPFSNIHSAGFGPSAR